ncbi:MAG: glycosyltransferase family 39 protein [Lentisphaeria bacterium]|nr:MAG: glycosyltransferase family 39 protein [Lentisphaeria bacterium]
MVFSGVVFRNASVANTDLMVGANLVIGTALLIPAARRNSTAWFCLAGAAFGVAAATKYLGFLLAPPMLLLLGAGIWFHRRACRKGGAAQLSRGGGGGRALLHRQLDHVRQSGLPGPDRHRNFFALSQLYDGTLPPLSAGRCRPGTTSSTVRKTASLSGMRSCSAPDFSPSSCTPPPPGAAAATAGCCSSSPRSGWHCCCSSSNSTRRSPSRGRSCRWRCWRLPPPSADSNFSRAVSAPGAWRL